MATSSTHRLTTATSRSLRTESQRRPHVRFMGAVQQEWVEEPQVEEQWEEEEHQGLQEEQLVERWV